MGIHVNLSADEASAEALDREPLPTGKYLVAITDIELTFSGESAGNPDHTRPFFKLELTVQQDGIYKGRKAWTNIMLHSKKNDGGTFTNFTLPQFLKAFNVPVSAGDLEIPDPEWFMGKQALISGTKKKGKPYTDRDGNPQEGSVQYNVQSWFPASKFVGSVSEGNSTVTTAPVKNSLLP
jgi:hypothetical protein